MAEGEDCRGWRGDQGYTGVTPEAFAIAFVSCLERESIQDFYLFNPFFDEKKTENTEKAEE